MTIKLKDLADFLYLQQELITALKSTSALITVYLALLQSQESDKYDWARYQNELKARVEKAEKKYQDLVEFIDE